MACTQQGWVALRKLGAHLIGSHSFKKTYHRAVISVINLCDPNAILKELEIGFESQTFTEDLDFALTLCFEISINIILFEVIYLKMSLEALAYKRCNREDDIENDVGLTDGISMSQLSNKDNFEERGWIAKTFNKKECKRYVKKDQDGKYGRSGGGVSFTQRSDLSLTNSSCDSIFIEIIQNQGKNILAGVVHQIKLKSNTSTSFTCEGQPLNEPSDIANAFNRPNRRLGSRDLQWVFRFAYIEIARRQCIEYDSALLLM
ncbi:uncharacterized protein LOC117119445 [Anneissia japonica]|uniref:uncharacterized protein LOC117119445 n=1 Tax=Anneissia japonica TaxID=1529436 RepID=UPI001425AEDD|nr:uncharacterized protein LOC117119445 [Anneissia japonica]